MSENTNRSAATEQNPSNGRWYIRLGCAGFNLRQNQVKGYATEAAARRAHERCARPR